MKVISCSSNLPLAQQIVKHLNIDLTQTLFKRFKDMEIFVEIMESVRGENVFVIQSTSYPANDNLMELLITIDAARRASARKIIAVIPYFGYARQDRKANLRTPISAKLVANMITAAGANQVLTLDLHTDQIQGFFDIPVDNLYAAPVIIKDIKEKYTDRKLSIVSPDIGGVIRARYIAKKIGSELIVIDKRRDNPGNIETLNIIGEVKGKDCIIIDDIVDSAGTICKATNALKDKEANSIAAYVTHPLFSKGAIEQVSLSKLKELVVTDSINKLDNIKFNSNMRAISIAPLIAEAIKNIHEENSLSNLFN